MANDRAKLTVDVSENHNGVDLTGDTAISASDKPEVADKPSFLKDVKNGLVHVAKTVWAVPEARGYVATLLVRLGFASPAIVAIVLGVIDGLAK